MSIELSIPALGESITEVEIGDWLKLEGSMVQKDESLVALESAKATVELPAPVSGKLAKIVKHKGATAAVGEVIAFLELADPPADSSAPLIPPPEAVPPASADSKPVEADQPAPETRPETKPTAARPPTAATVASETTSEIIREEPVPEPVAKAPQTSHAPSASAREEIVPMSLLRRTVAERLVKAGQTAALLTTFNEIDMTAVMGLRREFQTTFQEKYGVKLGLMSFFVKACVEALKAVPQVNAEVRGANIAYKNHYDLAVAIGGGKGLVAPVLRNAERLSFAGIELAIGDFARRAGENKLKPDELEGGTFTISNGGIYGSLLSTPIVNPPQSGILGLHAIQDRPVARDGNVVIRPMMYLGLTYDHRIVDGREAVTFLKRVKDTVENPARILLEI